MFHVKQPEKASPKDSFGMDTPLARELADLSARRRALETVNIDFTGDTRILSLIHI